MFQYTVGQDIIPHLKILVESATDAPGLHQIRLTLPLAVLQNEWTASAFENHLRSLYEVDARDVNGSREYVLKPEAETWKPAADSYVRRFAQHMSSYYELPLTAIYHKCEDPELCKRLTEYSASRKITDKLSIVDDLMTDDIKVTIKPCDFQNDFCAWLNALYTADRATNEDGSVTLSLKKLKGTEDTLSHPGHLAGLAQQIMHGWAVKCDDLTQNIQPVAARNYCEALLHIRSQNENAAEAPAEDYGKKIIITGVGFSGVSVTAQVLGQFIDEPPTKPIHITLIERNPSFFAAGLAYGAAGAEHRVNVQAPYMSLDPEQKEDLVNWLKVARHKGHLGDGKFLDIPEDILLPTTDFEHTVIQRRLEHYYLMDRLNQRITEAAARGVADVRVAFTEAMSADIVPGEKVTVQGKDGRIFEGTDLVLSNGHGPVRVPPFLVDAATQAPERVVTDQWSAGNRVEKLLSDPEVKNVVVLGTGLSAMDVVMTAEKEGLFKDPSRTLTLVSRGGHLHPILREGEPYEQPTVDTKNLISRLPQTVEGVPDFVQTVFGELKNQGQTTIGRVHTNEETFFALTSAIPVLLKASPFEAKDLMPLLQKYSSLITVSAVSMAPIIGATFKHFKDSGQIQILAAEPTHIERIPVDQRKNPDDCLDITLVRKGETDQHLHAGAIISALPPQSDPKSVPLLNDLMTKGWLTKEKKLGSGVSVNDDFRAIGNEDKVIPNLFVVGPVIGGKEMMDGKIGPLFQIASTLRVEANAIARDLVTDYRGTAPGSFCILKS